MKLQFFIQSPIHQTLTVTLEPTQSLTLHRLKSSLLPNPQSASSFYFSLNGKPLSDSTLLPNPQITPLSTFLLLPRFSGGGGDGGSTCAESRDCYLNMYAVKKPDKGDPNEKRLGKWLNCALSYEPLKEPCVIDKLGNIFNKETLVEALLCKKLPKEFKHIKGLKDMINVKLSMIPGKESSTTADGATFQCPITGLEFNGKYKFFALRNCGHIVSSKALKEVKSSACLICHKEFVESDKMVINGSDDEVAVLRGKMEEERTKAVEKKKKRGIDVVDEKKDCAKLEGNVKLENGNKSSNGGGVKKFKATDVAPAHATKEVYASIFTSSRKSNFKETYSCRSLPLGRN